MIFTAVIDRTICPYVAFSARRISDYIFDTHPGYDLLRIIL
jgi:hypothetical protein